tara:strand:+ start:38 stop:835 length:798 start_codon:yes stop_codon:yes gene_type:complete
MKPNQVKEIYGSYWNRIENIIQSVDPSKVSLDDLWGAITYSEITDSFLDIGYKKPNYNSPSPHGSSPDFKSSFKDYCSIKKSLILEEEIEDAELIIDMGSGWGRNAVFLAQKFPDKTIVALEYCEEGSRATNLISDKYELPNIITAPFDYYNPSALESIVFPFAKTVDSAYFFSSFSIEQVPYLGEDFILNILHSPFAQITTLHFEPIGWQIKNISKNTQGYYNNDLFPILRKLQASKMIKIDKIEADIFGDIKNPGSKIVWTRQ